MAADEPRDPASGVWTSETSFRQTVTPSGRLPLGKRRLLLQMHDPSGSLDDDLAKVRRLMSQWVEKRLWAESVILEALGLQEINEVFRLGRGLEFDLPGTQWSYRSHGKGIDFHRRDGTGGIDFDLDTPLPDEWRLREFALRCVEEAVMSLQDYESVFGDAKSLRLKMDLVTS